MESTRMNIPLGGTSLYFQTFHFIIKEDTIPYRTNRNFKDRMFQLLFSEKDAAWELFCALEGDEFMEKGDAGRLEYDLLLLSIVEHQSTWIENMPLRELAYLGRTYEMNRDEAIQNAVHSCEFLFSSLFASGGRRKGLLR